MQGTTNKWTNLGSFKSTLVHSIIISIAVRESQSYLKPHLSNQLWCNVVLSHIKMYWWFNTKIILEVGPIKCHYAAQLRRLSLACHCWETKEGLGRCNPIRIHSITADGSWSEDINFYCFVFIFVRATVSCLYVCVPMYCTRYLFLTQHPILFYCYYLYE